MEYRLAKEVEAVARDLIAEHHPHLLAVRITYVFMDKTPKSKGRDVWGRAKKVGGLNALLALGPNALPDSYEDQPYDLFVIEVSEEVWDHLKPAARSALVDHELSHCEIRTDEDGGVSLAIVGHDVTEFEAIVRRHGLWNEGLQDFADAAEQLSLGAVDETGVVEEGEVFDVSITHKGRTVHTNTETLGRMAAGEVPTGVSS